MNTPKMLQAADLPSIETPVADGGPAGRGASAWNVPWLGTSLAAMCLLGVSDIALASPGAVFVAPAGVTDYRLAFVTDDTTMAGTSSAVNSSISTYNAFVTADAANNPNLPTTTWSAIVSTATMSATANIFCGSHCNASVPIYPVDGTTLVATSATALFAGTILNAIDKDENGIGTSASYVWTGSNADGTAASGNELGLSAPEYGDPYSTTGTKATRKNYRFKEAVWAIWYSSTPDGMGRL
jgi:hypothetical protein